MKQPNKITTIQQLRDDLVEAYESLKADPRKLCQVAELANTAGKIIGTVKIELEYAALRRERPEIPFIGNNTNCIDLPNRPAAKALSYAKAKSE